MRTLIQDVRFGVRTLLAHPGFAAVALLALAAGIGINTAIYSVAEALLYHPLLLPDLDRAVSLQGIVLGTSDQDEEFSPADFLDIRREAKTVEHVAAVNFVASTLTAAGDPIRIEGAGVSTGFFEALAGQTRMGRVFLAEEDQPGGKRVVVLSRALWMSQFGGDPRILSQTIQLDGQAYQVVGVMQSEFLYPPTAEFWIPLALSAERKTQRRERYLEVIGRLRAGASAAQATAELKTITGRLEHQYPSTNARVSARAALVRETISGDLTARYTRLTLGAVLFVLLIACSNVANLQFARISLRSREIAVRSALGAKRSRIVRQLLTESVLLALAGAAAGILLAFWSLDLMRAGMNAEVSRHLPGWGRIGLNLSVLVYTAALAVAAGIISGVAPAWSGSKTDLLQALKEGGRGSTAGRGRLGLRSALVVSQIVLALTLLVGAGLLVKGITNVHDPRPGMHPETALTFRIALPRSRYPAPPDIVEFQRRALASLASIPGVISVATVTDVPYGGSSAGTDFTIEARPPQSPAEQPNAQLQSISPNYFRVAHIPVVAGREFTELDGAHAPGAAIVSESLARRYFGNENPLGWRVKLSAADIDGPYVTIVGVAGDVLQNPFEGGPRSVIYRPREQAPPGRATYFIRMPSEPLAIAGGVRARIAAIDANQPVSELMTFRKVIDDQLLGYRYVVVIMGVCGVLALALAAIGVFGIMAFSVAERTNEIGLRMALGADAGDVYWMVARWGLRLTAIGLALGLPAALALARLLSGLLFGVSAYDLATFGGGVLALCAAAMLACYFPVRRAAAVDPMLTLRSD
jgi:putative ABC transport system permease protein